MGGWARALSKILDLLSPPLCAACDAASEATFCASCGMPAALDAAPLFEDLPLIVVGGYAPPLSLAITRLKYAGRAELAKPLAKLLGPQLAAAGLPADASLAPVPLHPKRLAARGYNQAALLAQEVAALSKRPCHARLLERVRDTPHQVGQSRHERLGNVSGAFRVRQTQARRIVLVDDVITTGSTVRACAQALAEQGLELTAILALARAEHC